MTNREARRQQNKGTGPKRPPQQGRGNRPGPRQTRTPQRSSSGPSQFFTQPYLLGVAALVIILAGVLIFIASRSGGGDTSLVSDLNKAATDLPVDLASGTKLGKDDAPVKLTEFEDFQCPFCLRYTSEDEPSIVADYVKTGKVQIIYNHLPILGAESLRAAEASECAADQNKFWQYHNTLFLTEAKAGQASGEKIDKGRFSDDNLKGFAKDLGLDTATFNDCLDSGKYLDKVNSQDQAAKSAGITGTPNFLINGVAGYGDPGAYSDWQKLLDAQITNAVATATAAASATANATPAATGSATAGSGTTTPAASTTPTPVPTTAVPAATATATKAP